jgi:hypothetical protein
MINLKIKLKREKINLNFKLNPIEGIELNDIKYKSLYIVIKLIST